MNDGGEKLIDDVYRLAASLDDLLAESGYDLLTCYAALCMVLAKAVMAAGWEAGEVAATVEKCQECILENMQEAEEMH